MCARWRTVVVVRVTRFPLTIVVCVETLRPAPPPKAPEEENCWKDAEAPPRGSMASKGEEKKGSRMPPPRPPGNPKSSCAGLGGGMVVFG